MSSRCPQASWLASGTYSAHRWPWYCYRIRFAHRWTACEEFIQIPSHKSTWVPYSYWLPRLIRIDIAAQNILFSTVWHFPLKTWQVGKSHIGSKTCCLMLSDLSKVAFDKQRSDCKAHRFKVSSLSLGHLYWCILVKFSRLFKYNKFPKF